MSSVDVLLVAVLLTTLLYGQWNGLVYEVTSLLGWVCAFYAAQWLAAGVGAQIPWESMTETLRYAVGFAVVFVATGFITGLIALRAKKWVQTAGLRPVDRTLGGIFGVFLGAALLLAAALLVSMTPLKNEEIWHQSVGVAWLKLWIDSLRDVLPASLAQHLP